MRLLSFFRKNKQESRSDSTFQSRAEEDSDAVRNRGKYMQEAVPVGVGAMAAILGLPAEAVEAGCAEAAKGQICSPANINSPSQVVIAGNADAIDRACEILKAKGAKRAIKLNVSAPFHCALMMPAQERLSAELAGLVYGEFEFPIVHNVDALVSLTSVKKTSFRWWLPSIETLAANGVDKFVEIGPGKVLSGLVRQIVRESTQLNIEDSVSLKNTLETL